MELAIVRNEQLTELEKLEIDKQIDSIIDKHKGNSFEINRLVFESVTALETSNSYTRELESQGTVKRFFGMISGKNRNIQSEIDKNLYRSQYSSQQTLQKLAEQNLMSFELLTAVNNKLNSSIIEIEKEINTIYGTLVTFFKQTKSNLIQIENRLDKLERNVNILNWVNTIEYQMFNDREYCDLDKIQKIVCLVTDFYEITKGNWTTSDLLLLKSAINEIGLSPKDNISYEEFIRFICEDEILYNRLIGEDVRGLDNEKYMNALIISGISKAKLLESNEKYVINTVINQLENNGIEIDDKEIKYSLVNNYITQTNFIDAKKEVNLFDFMVELLFNISIFEYIVDEEYINAKIDINNMNLEKLVKYADKGNSEAQLYIGILYMDKEIKEYFKEINIIEDISIEGMSEDLEKAKYYIKKASENENCKAKFILGMLLEADSKEEAIKWYEKAAEQGLAQAQYELGFMYNYGIGIEEDYKKAIKWYEKAAEQGLAQAQCSLGYMYQLGYGVEKDYKEAIKWYEKAEEQGLAEAQCSLGYMYQLGYGVEKDYKEAIKWYEKAAEQGDSEGQYELGDMYYFGHGVEKDYESAFNLYKKSAYQDSSKAQYRLGKMYYYGEYVERDYEESKIWMEKAAKGYNSDAKEFLKEKF